MPTTRSQAAEERAPILVHEDSPASPSANSVPVDPQSTATTRVGTTANEVGMARTVPRLTEHVVGATSRATRAPSVRSHKSTASAAGRIRQAELDAEEKLAEIRRQELQLQAALIRKRLALDVATIREETDRDSICPEEAAETEQRVKEWLHHNQPRGEQPEDTEQETSAGRYPSLPPTTREGVTGRPTGSTHNRVTFEEARRPRSPTPNRPRDRDIEHLAEALERMARTRIPSRQTQDLPVFSGATGEWLPFKAAMRESTGMHKFSPAENLARLRACLRGEARECVSALLYTAAEPSIIMQTLEQCFGRPEAIIDKALDDIKKLPRLGTSATELNGFAIKLQNITTTIMCIDERGYLQNPMLARQVTDKLTPHIKSRWCDYASEYGNRSEPEIVTLSRFLMREADRAIRYTYSSTTATTTATRGAVYKHTEQRRSNERSKGANVYATTDDTNKKRVCFCCGAEHDTNKCPKIAAMPTAQRWEWAKESRTCFKCMNSKHRRFHCKSKHCGVGECRQPHHALLHMKSSESVNAASDDDVIAATARSAKDNKVLLKVCQVMIRGPDGKETHTYALLDEGSTITLVDREIAEIVGARGPTRALNIHGVATSQREPDSQCIKIEIRGQSEKEYHPINARTVNSIALGSQSVKSEWLKHSHLRDVNIEPMCYDEAKPRILIGADNWHLIVTRKLLTGKMNQPAASLTKLGWIVHGSVPRSLIKLDSEAVLHIRTSQYDEKLDDLVKTHFELDALGVSMKRRTLEREERAKEIFEHTAKKVGDHYEVGLPWKTDDVTMPPNYDMALSRLRSIERKMDKSPQFKAAYTAQMEGLIQKGYAERCDEDHEGDQRLWYLPHFAVTNPHKPNKVRLVHDAAAHSGGVCLNDALLDGPDLLQSLHGVLFRFREKPIAVTADIREMFMRIKIRKCDRVAQHFLWRGDERSKPPEKYVMTSMIFGARSSPFLAHSVRDRNADDHKTTHPLAHTAITHSHYMDDWVDSFDSEEIAARTIQEVQEVHGGASFELAGWNSNREHLLSHIPDVNKASAPKQLGASAHPHEKTLGIIWAPNTDELAFNTRMPRVPIDVKNGNRTPTKREALGAVMSIFDPLGLLSPYTITAKIMLQGLWKKKVEWDDPLPYEEATVFREWYEDLKFIANLRIPRCYDLSTEIMRVQLHVMNDASAQAVVTAAYYRFSRRDGSVHVMLVAGKAKVAPMKAQSIPRLELQAALMGARLARDVIEGHRRKPDEVIMWSDSKTVLQWIRNDTTRYAPYVDHRLSEITDLTRAEQWRWCDTASNCADDASRPGNNQLRATDRWFIGPAFLYGHEDDWPQEKIAHEEHAEVFTTHASEFTPLLDIKRFSSYERAVRAMAYVLVFIEKCQKRKSFLALEHIDRAEKTLIKEAQRESFPEEIKKVAAGRNVERQSRLYRLDPTCNKDGLLCLHGRINAATVPEEMKSPPILDGAHPLTRLLIKREHIRNSHVGREQIVNNLRQRYWILRLRPAVRSVVGKCALCKLRRAAPAVPVKGDLPKARLTAYSRPFSRCGIDCFGPMWVTIGRRKEKRWGMLFTCMITRAVHIELVASLSTDSAVLAMRRMASRRGWPELIFSDNGTNFKGAQVELDKAFEEWLPALQDYALSRRVRWSYSNPGGPNEGGCWERLISSVKRALKVVLNERSPKEEVLATALTEIEHTINARPLTHVAVSHDDAEALTPNHFLLGTAVGLPHVGTCDVADRRLWRASQALANMFWARWIDEYLPTLTPRGDVRKNFNNIKIGDVVLIVDGLLPRNVWPRGQVNRVYTGPDGIVRSADVRTRGGVFKRPVRRLIVLPTEEGLRSAAPGGECYGQ